MTTTIPSGSLQGYYDLDLKLEGLDLINKYILPVKIATTSYNNVSKRKWFSKSLMQIVPFNDYSGRYSNAGLIWNRDVPQNNQTALSTPYAMPGWSTRIPYSSPAISTRKHTMEEI